MKKSILSAIVLLFISAIAFSQNTREEQVLQALQQSGMVRMEGNHIIFKVKKASDTGQIKLLYGALFASDKFTVGFDVDGKYFGNKNNIKKDISSILTTEKKPENETPVYTEAAQNTARLNSADEQYFQSGSFLIRTARDYRYLTIKGGEPAENAHVQLNSFLDNSINQHWKLVVQNDGLFKIQSENGLCLTAGFVPTMKPFTNPETQLWKLEDAGNGFYSIVSKKNLYMFLSGHVNRENAGVTFTGKNNSVEQRWHLIRWTNDDRRMTSFIPETHGFRFINDFNGEDFIRWGGLCGGMVYTALDYFNKGIDIPRQYYMPANATTLQSYIYNRQQNSIWDVNSNWSELEVSYNTRASEIFRWGIQGTGGGRLEELKDKIDANTSVPIGLFAGGVLGKDNSDGKRHVVLGIGYSMGRYLGDLGENKGDYKIFVYDPNYGNTMRTLVPDLEKECYFEVETGKAWRAYFVNKRYDDSHTPPRDVPNYPEGQEEGSVRHLYARFETGNDDLRGGNNNVDIIIRYKDGIEQRFLNVNDGARWVDKSIQTVHLTLNRSVSKQDIEHFFILFYGRSNIGSIGSDNWNLKSLEISSGFGGILYASAYPPPGEEYFYRFIDFTSTQRSVTIYPIP